MANAKPAKKPKPTKRAKSRKADANLELADVQPITDNQVLAFDAYADGKHLMLHGIAGTGKTYIGLYFGLHDALERYEGVNRVVIVRSIVPTRDVGFLPGTVEEKSEVYEAPYRGICNQLFNRGDAYDILKKKRTVEFMTTSFIRGITIDNAVVVVDEVQNLDWNELHSIMTRIGENCKVIFCGDYSQSDLKGKSGLLKFNTIIKTMPSFEFVGFVEEDIVRSDLVKEYIIAEAQYERKK